MRSFAWNIVRTTRSGRRYSFGCRCQLTSTWDVRQRGRQRLCASPAPPRHGGRLNTRLDFSVRGESVLQRTWADLGWRDQLLCNNVNCTDVFATRLLRSAYELVRSRWCVIEEHPYTFYTVWLSRFSHISSPRDVHSAGSLVDSVSRDVTLRS